MGYLFATNLSDDNPKPAIRLDRKEGEIDRRSLKHPQAANVQFMHEELRAQVASTGTGVSLFPANREQ
jgi:hypothetical protein